MTRSWNLGKYYELIHDGSKNCGNVSNISTCVSSGILGTSPASGDGAAGGAADHYLIGNYYSWNTATAGTGGTITSGTASDSICPRNWKLPTSNNQTKGSFYYLLSKYGLTSSVSAGSYNIARSPLYFVRSGHVFPASSAGRGPSLSVGNAGWYWSSRAGNINHRAYYLYFDKTTVNPSKVNTDGDDDLSFSDYSNRRYVGLSLRCLARELRVDGSRDGA